ncbi:uncharacterized protein LOC113425784 [Notechis scutatus]|uniref:Uncharacterized protein LOC113425784 n=1 Tax=Notechis scutatus TaxID=8663 RepID=A0A6J1VV42_9SAUR|nr:uncharacterized protein LOC113425784 [Notechis scutatus]
MASAFEEAPVVGFLFFIAGVSLLSACFVALCVACKRCERQTKVFGKGKIYHVDLAVPGPMVPLAFGGSLPNLQQDGGSDPGDASIAPALLTLPRLSDKDVDTVGSCSFHFLPQRDLPNVSLSPEVTYSNLSFPKRGEVTLFESQRVEGEENQNSHPAADKMVENVQAGGPSYACVAKKKKEKKKATNGKQTWMEMDKPQEMDKPPLTGTALPPPTKEIEEMYSVVCKKKKKKKTHHSEGAGEETAPQAKGIPAHCQERMVSQESNGIASYQSSSAPTATEPYYESVPCEPRAKVASQPVAEPAYESVDTYCKEVKRKWKAPKNKMAPENLYESIDRVAIQGQD